MDDIGELIASRNMTLRRKGEEAAKVSVLIGKPYPMDPEDPRSTDFFCRYRIEGGGVRRFLRVAGVDSLQAIELTLKSIAADLERIEESSGGELAIDEGEG